MPEHTPTYAQTTAQACRIVLDHAHMVALRKLIRPVVEDAAFPAGRDSYTGALPVMILSHGGDKPDWAAYRARTPQNEIIWKTVGATSHWAGVSDETHLFGENGQDLLRPDLATQYKCYVRPSELAFPATERPFPHQLGSFRSLPIQAA